jgi:Flp pilus assembly protein TadG
VKDPRRLRPGRSNRRSRDGSSAVEFAMVAFPFFFMLFAIMEVGLIFVTDSILENATIETGRLIRTGQAANSSLTAAQFKTSLCSRMSIFSSDCASRATVDVREITQFRNVNPPDPLANGTSFDTSGLTYVTGQPGSLMLVRVWYKQTLITPFMAQSLSKLGNGAAMLTATTTFRNEPYNQ